jgi:hypothetical protein
MNDDLLRSALRHDADLLLRSAPQLDTAAMWHRVQRARARKIERVLYWCGWLLRVVITAVSAGIAWLAPTALIGIVVPLLLVLWMTSGMCAPVREIGPIVGVNCDPS